MVEICKIYNALFSICLLLLFQGCSTTKTHVVFNGIVKLDSSELSTDYNEINNKKNDSLFRGKFPNTTFDNGYLKFKSEYAIFFQTIGKIKWKTEVGISFKSYFEGNGFYKPNGRDLSDELVKTSSSEKLDIGMNYTLNSFKDYINETNKINSLADDQDKIDYSYGHIPIMFLSDFLVTPYTVNIIDNVPFTGNDYFAKVERLNSPICYVDSNVNLGHLTVVAAKKYNNKYANAKILYKFLEYLYYELKVQYKCNVLLSSYLNLFDSLEIQEMTNLNIASHGSTFFTISNMYSCLDKNMHLPYISSFPNYSLESTIHQNFLKHYDEIYSNYKSTALLENGFVDSVLINKIDIVSLTKSMDSLSRLIDKDYIDLTAGYKLLYDNMFNYKSNEASTTLKKVGTSSDNLDNKMRLFSNVNELISKLKDRLKSNSYKDEKLNKLVSDIDKSKEESMKYFNINLNEYKSIVSNIEKHIASRKTDKLNQHIDSILALPIGTVMRFTPFSIDYIDERDNSTTAVTNPLVIVKKINNVNRKSILVKVLQLPIPSGFNSQMMQVDYSLALGAEVVLPLSEFEGYPGDSSTNQMMNFIDLLR
jgi:hypothetical protein